jgi:hypothetical protein
VNSSGATALRVAAKVAIDFRSTPAILELGSSWRIVGDALFQALNALSEVPSHCRKPLRTKEQDHDQRDG